MRIGLDFDNTIAGYDALFLRIGLDMGWLPAHFAGMKKDIRDQVRLLPDGNDKWTEMQALAYGPHMPQAEIFDGVKDFMKRSLGAGHDLVIVSHKTQFAAARPDGVDLRQASLAWMEAQGFFDPADIGLDRDKVFFESTRAAKCRRIAELGCAIFVDVLEEVFDDPSFTRSTRGLLFQAEAPLVLSGHFEAVTSWREIGDAVFGSG